MNLLFYRYGNICEPDVLAAMQSMQIHVKECDIEMTEKQLLPSEKLSFLLPMLTEESYDILFSMNYFPFLSVLCERLGLLYVCWSTDSPVLELFSDTIHNSCNRIFLFDYAQYERFHGENPDRIFYLPLAANTERWDRLLEPADDRKLSRRFHCDLSFVGSLYHEKSPLALRPLSSYQAGYAEGLCNAWCRLIGTPFPEAAVSDDFIGCLKKHFPDFYTDPNSFCNTDRYVATQVYLASHTTELDRVSTLNALAERFPVTLFTRSDTSKLKNVDCRPGISTHREMPYVFRYSKINLNMTLRSIETGLPLRIWDVLGCGGFLLTNYQAELPEYLTPGQDLDCYESIPELLNKVSFYLAHDDLRREIAESGHAKVKELHTYRHRLTTMLQLL